MFYFLDVAIWPMVLGFGLVILFTLGMIVVAVLYAIRLIRHNRDKKPVPTENTSGDKTEGNN